MSKRCFESLIEPESMENLNNALSRSLKTSEEIRAELDAIKTCPSPCEDGIVSIRTSSGLNRRAACPVMNAGCPYGIRSGEKFYSYIARIMNRIGVPRRHIENFGKRGESYAVSEADKWPVRGFLLLCGKTGSGKSFAAASVVRGYLESRVKDRLVRETWGAAERAGESVIWVSAKDIADGRDISVTRSGVRGNISLLVLDSLGREEETKTAISALCSAVSKRYDAKQATVITTELSMSDISKRYGRFFADRLAEDIGDGGCLVDCGDVSIRWPDTSGPRRGTNYFESE
jgi:DNA replication protein DnaC